MYTLPISLIRPANNIDMLHGLCCCTAAAFGKAAAAVAKKEGRLPNDVMHEMPVSIDVDYSYDENKIGTLNTYTPYLLAWLSCACIILWSMMLCSNMLLIMTLSHLRFDTAWRIAASCKHPSYECTRFCLPRQWSALNPSSSGASVEFCCNSTCCHVS